jgi:hypothetical protein
MAEATASAAATLVPSKTFGVHISNLSSNTSAETLATEFHLPVQFILMDTKKNEAWARNFHKEDWAQRKAQTLNGKRIDNQVIQCRAVVEFIHIAKLCGFYRTDNCAYNDKCSNAHVSCSDRDQCIQKNCYYGHSKKRPEVKVDLIDYNGNINIFLFSNFARFILTQSL